MTLPRDGPFEREPTRTPQQERPARGIPAEKMVENIPVATHAEQHMGGDDPINPDGIDAAPAVHGHAVALDVLLPPTLDHHDAPIGNWPVILTGDTHSVYFVWRVGTEWAAFNRIAVVMIPDTEEEIQMDIDVAVSAEGEQYDADERQALNETKAIAAGDVDDLVEWDILDIGPLFADIVVGDFVTVKLTSDIDGLVIVGLHINYDAGGWSGGGGAGHDAVTVIDGRHSLSGQQIAGVAASTAQVGHAELATAAEAAAGVDSGRVVTPSLLPVLVQDSKYVYAADAEASDTYVITLTPAIGAYAVGQVFQFKANTINTGAASLNVNGKGAKTIKKLHDQDLADGDIEAGQIVTVVYDGTNFQMQSQVANAVGAHGIAAHTEHGNWKLLVTDGSGDEQEIAHAADGKKLVGFGVAAAPQWEIDYETINFIINGGGAEITTGLKGVAEIPCKGEIVECRLLADQGGAIKVDIWKCTYAEYDPDGDDDGAHPADGDSITGGNEPEIAATGHKDSDATLTDWTKSLTAEEILGFNVDSCTTITWCTVVLKLKRLLDT